MKIEFTKELEKGIESLHTQGAFLTVKSGEIVNTMTISWGSIGFMWQKPVFIAMVRKSRYTYQLIEESKNFSISIPYGTGMKNALLICGTKSGRDVDKCSEAGISFIPSTVIQTPVVAGCNLYYECKTVYTQPMGPERLVPDIQNTMYGNDDYHTLYFGEIVACYQR